MNKAFSYHFLLLAVTVLTAFQCSMGPEQLAGGGSDTEVSGRIVQETGAGAGTTTVLLIPYQYNPVVSSTQPLSTTTSSNGNYSFNGMAPGRYNIEAVHATDRTRLLITGVEVSDGKKATVPAETLKTPGSIYVPLPRRSRITGHYAFIQGTTVHASGRQPYEHGNHAILDSVPPCLLPDICYGVSGSEELVAPVTHDALVQPQQRLATVPCGTWQYSVAIYMNTGTTGAAITEDVYHHPILIRLDESNFAFEQARADGRDIRFSTGGTAYLPYEIESWDAAQRTAHVWVEVDTIRAGVDSQAITMHWGNPDIPDWSASELVFDTSAQYAGVWHLDDPSDLDDATWHQNTGINFNAINTPAVIGKGLDFQAVHFAQLPANAFIGIRQTITISLWLYGDPLLQPRNNFAFLAKDSLDRRMIAGCVPWGDEGISWQAGRIDNGAIDVAVAPSDSVGQYEGQWNYWTFTKDAATGTMRIYYNGNLWLETGGMSGIISGIAHFYLGDCTVDGNHFGGMMDEFHVSTVVRSPSWIKISYENQRADGRFLSFQQ